MDRQDMENILFDDTNTSSDSETSTIVEAETSTLVEEEETSTSVIDIPAIPNGMAPLELLMSLDEDTCLTIYCRRNEEGDPKWTPHYVGLTANRYLLLVSTRLLSIGYCLDDEIEDSKWLHQLAPRIDESSQSSRDTVCQITWFVMHATSAYHKSVE
jgi:hypothetical protein